MGGFWSEEKTVEVERVGRRIMRKDDFKYTDIPIFVPSNYCEVHRMFTTPSNELSVNLKNYGVLPDLVISNIAQFLPIRNLPCFFSTCRLFYHCANSNHFWRVIFQSSFSEESSDDVFENQVKSTINWKKQFYFLYRNYKEEFYSKKYPVLKEKVNNLSPLKLKSVLLGNIGVGKTSFVDRAAYNRFRMCYRSTIGVDFFSIQFFDSSTGGSFILQLWDTFGEYVRMFYRGADIVFLCFSINNRKSFVGENSFRRNFKELKESDLFDPSLRKEERPVIILLGMKCDLEEKREVSAEEAIEYVRENKEYIHGYIENSGKTGKHRMVTLGVALDLVKKRVKYMEEEEENSYFEDLL